jgi:hypothetical protein
MNRRIVFALAALLSAKLAHAEEVNVASFEYLDVLETSDGSTWKGVVIEQTPNVQYKLASADGSVHVIKADEVVRLTKARNPQYHQQRVATSSVDAPMDDRQSGVDLPQPFMRDGVRLDTELDIVFPTGDLGNVVNTSYAPTVRLGYEALFGRLGVTGGFQGRYTYWQLPGNTMDAIWTLETQAYGRAAVHVGRAAPYVGLALGLDTNYVHAGAADVSMTNVGFGVNLAFGLPVAITPGVAFEIGGDYHPGTDTLSDVTHQSTSYFALRLGSSFHF